MITIATGPEQVSTVCDEASELLATALDLPETTGSLEQWADAAAAAQRVINTATAVQNACIARLAAIEPELLDDGTWVEGHRALGHLALDAPAILSGALNVSCVHAEHRVVTAVQLAADGPDGTSTDTGLAGLHHSMATGVLDAYRASVLVDELEAAPPQVRATVIAALEPLFEREDGTHLRRRARRHLARISPDLLRQRAARARAESGLQRWADEPGVDKWVGTFPSEEAAHAWAAIDTLAQQYRADGTCATVERARAKALTDLVAGNSTATYVVTLTVPATHLGATTAEGRTAAATADAASSPVGTTDPGIPGTGTTRMPETGDDDRADTNDASARLRLSPNPGDLVEVGGLGPGDKALVARGWLDAVLARAAGSTTQTSCHPVTGAVLHGQDAPRPTGASDRPDSDTYRPGRRLTALVKARDGRCRFPGCTIAARFCDLDHVRPWPTGPTSGTNLICLCRRHHRIKQRHGWRVTLHPAGTAAWTDPTGRHRTTHPVDALRGTVLPAPSTSAGTETAVATSTARTDLSDGPHSYLEFRLEHVCAAIPTTCGTAVAASWADATGQHLEVQPVRGTPRLDPGAHWPHHRPHPRTGCQVDDPPPF